VLNEQVHHVRVAHGVHRWNQYVLKLLAFVNSWLNIIIPVTPRASTNFLPW